MSYDPQDAINLLRSYIRHRACLREALGSIRRDLESRADLHDLSKMLDDEFSGFSRINAAARVHKFGSPEYDAGLAQERPMIDLHYLRNPHHPERAAIVAGKDTEPDDYRYACKLAAEEQSWLDVVEMVCDWWAAWRGYDDNKHTWPETVDMNLARREWLSDRVVWLARQVADDLAKLEVRHR